MYYQSRTRTIFDPCCGCMELQKAVKVCAIIKTVCEVLAIAAIGALLGLVLWACEESQSQCHRSIWVYVASAFLGTIMLFNLIQVVVNFVLIYAASQKNLKTCKICYAFYAVTLTIVIICACISAIKSFWCLVIAVGQIAWAIYFLMVVSAFNRQLSIQEAGDGSLIQAYAAMKPAPVYGQPMQAPQYYNYKNDQAYNNSYPPAPSNPGTPPGYYQPYNHPNNYNNGIPL